MLSHNDKWIAELSSQFSSFGLKVYSSQTNFILVEFPANGEISADQVNAYLNQNGIIPRQFALDDFKNKLRFTTVEDQGMEKTIEILGRFLGFYDIKPVAEPAVASNVNKLRSFRTHLLSCRLAFVSSKLNSIKNEPEYQKM